MLYEKMRDVIDRMVEDVYAGKAECRQVISYTLIGHHNVPITITCKLLYPLSQIRVSLYCPFLVTENEHRYEELYQPDNADYDFNLRNMLADFAATLEGLSEWISVECPDMIRWGEGVVFDHNGRARAIPFPSTPVKTSRRGRTRKKKPADD